MKNSYRSARRILAVLTVLTLLFVTACSSKNENTVTGDDNNSTHKYATAVASPKFNYGDAPLYATNDVLRVALDCPTFGAQIYFAIDQNTDYTPYTDPIRINQNTTIYAYAELDGTQSSVVSADYKVAYAGSDISDYTDDTQNALIIYNDEDYTFKNWDDHLVCRLDGYDGWAGYFLVNYQANGNDPQLSYAYVEGSEWREVYNCIALSSEAGQLVIPFNGGAVMDSLYNEIHMMGQQVTVNSILFIPNGEINYSAIEGGTSLDDDPSEPDDDDYTGDDEYNGAIFSEDDYFVGTWLFYNTEDMIPENYGFELTADGIYNDYPTDEFSRPFRYDVEGEAIFVMNDGEILYTFYFDDTEENRMLVSDDGTIFVLGECE